MINLIFIFLSTYADYKATYVRCHDGDTCTFDIHIGFGLQVRKDVRVCDIDAPELKQPKGKFIRDYVSSLLVGSNNVRLFIPLKRNCIFNCEKKSFNRIMAKIHVDGKNLAHLLLHEEMVTLHLKRCP